MMEGNNKNSLYEKGEKSESISIPGLPCSFEHSITECNGFVPSLRERCLQYAVNCVTTSGFPITDDKVIAMAEKYYAFIQKDACPK